jgi:hypothetical protein
VEKLVLAVPQRRGRPPLRPGNEAGLGWTGPANRSRTGAVELPVPGPPPKDSPAPVVVWLRWLIRWSWR